MSNEFEIKPFSGVGPLRFGMTPQEVATALGPPEASRRPFMNTLIEYRGWLTTMYEKDSDLLYEVGFSRFFETLTYKGTNIFKDPDQEVLRKLCTEDGQPYEALGFIVLLKLGMTLTGFHDGDEEKKTCSAFAKGTWGVEKDELKPFSFDATKS